ncbi:MAG: glycosyltransferase family 4 protein [Promethearchaeota archaeon]|jgi:glycosyltransferase involved in cell wall biosynthesis
MIKERKKIIYYCTHSNLKDLSYGDSNNDNKFIVSIPREFEVEKVFPERNEKGTVSLFSLLKIIIRLLMLSIKSNQKFVIRGTRAGIIPFFFKKLLKHIIILNLGCTPFSTIERIAFSKNPSFQTKPNAFTKIRLKIEFQLEKLVLRNADIIYVENEKAKNLVNKYAKGDATIIIIPYYVQDYFLTTTELNYNVDDGKPLIIGYTGRFHRYDKLDPFIDALKILKEKEFPFLIKLVGDGVTKKKIEEKARRLDLLDSVKFLGAQEHQEVSKIIDTEHMLILPMVSNTCPSTVPIKMLEGIIKGKVILTNNSGNIKSLFKPHTELVLDDFSNPHKIAEQIISIAQNYLKYHKFAEELRTRHLKSRNSEFFRNKILKSLNHIK